MQRWFFLEDRKRPKTKPPTPKRMSIKDQNQDVAQVLFQKWTFCVNVPDIGAKEHVYITGSTLELGEWELTECVPMDYDAVEELWIVTIVIPNTCNVYYRYAVCSKFGDPPELIVKRWETIVNPRVITDTQLHPTIDQFGQYNNNKRIERGWLTAQSLVQFKFIKNPLKLKSRKAGRLMYIKITPVKLSFEGDSQPRIEESSLSFDTMDSVDTPEGVTVEVSSLDNDPARCVLHPQGQFGREYRPNDVLLINVYAPDPKNLAYLVDFFCYSSRAATEDPPCHVGYTYVLPNMFKPSEGSFELPVTCNVKHRPLGTVYFEYLIVKPMAEQLCDFKVSYSKHWNPAWTGLEVGHRGLGASFKTKEGNAIRENTVASLKKAAASGADLLEFDVQLSKDMIPVIYHDYYVCISMKRKKEVDFSEMLTLPVKELTLEHLHKLKVYHLVEGKSHETLFNDDDLEEHQPFPTLEQLMTDLEPHIGFNVELKWNMELDDGTFELDNPFDMNLYVDKVLAVVLKYAEGRRIVFSCFNPDICTMVRNKQNKYPVMFLTQGVTNKYQPYHDPRTLSIPAAVQNSVSSDILGIVVHTEDLLRDPTQVKLATDAGLIIFCWGDDNNDKKTIQRLKEMGLHAVIYDKIDQFTTKDMKESIFLVEARASERELMRLALLEHEQPESPLPASALSALIGSGSISGSTLASGSGLPDLASVLTPPPPQPRPFFDLTVRDRIPDHSTATSLESLASSVDLRDESQRKRNLELISNYDKESQTKEQRNTFRGVYPCGDNDTATRASAAAASAAAASTAAGKKFRNN